MDNDFHGDINELLKQEPRNAVEAMDTEDGTL